MSVDFLDLSIRELSRNFGRRRALSRVSLDCRAGGMTAVIEPVSEIVTTVPSMPGPYRSTSATSGYVEDSSRSRTLGS